MLNSTLTKYAHDVSDGWNPQIGDRVVVIIGDECLGSYVDEGEFGVEAFNDAYGRSSLGIFDDVAAADKKLFDRWWEKHQSNGGASTADEEPDLQPGPAKGGGGGGPLSQDATLDDGESLTFLDRGMFGIEAFDNGVSFGVFTDQEAAVSGYRAAKSRAAGNGGDLNSGDESHPMLAAALNYVEQHGWKSFPARMEDGKKWSWLSAEYAPGGENWGMTNDPEQLRHNFFNKKWRHLCGVGVPTGWVNRIFDIEADTKEAHGADGLASLSMLEANYGKLPDTLMAESPTGSPHRIYRHPGQDLKVISRGLPGYPGIDIKGDGGMFVAPPSVRGDGQYKWLNDLPIADAPQWLIDLVTAESKGKGKSKSKSKRGNDWPEKAKPADVFNGAKVSPAFAHLKPGNGLGAGLSEDYPPLPFEPILAECGFLREAYETGGANLSEPLWHDNLRCCIFLKDGENLIHTFSKGYDGYDRKATEAKFDQACKAKEAKDLGYPKCQTICDHGSEHCKTCPHLALGGSPLNLGLTPEQGADAGVKLRDFYAYMPLHNYIFAPSREPWPAASVNARISPVVIGVDDEGENITMTASVWIDRNQPVEQMTWAPGMPMIIADRLIADGGWIERKGVSCFNLYRPPTIKLGDAGKAGPWIDLVHKVFPADADHIIKWFAQRRQHPDDKVNHGLVLGSNEQGIGKDTILEGVKRAVGAWNFKEVAPKNIFDGFNPWRRGVILRVSEAKDMGDVSRFELYDGMKTLLAAPPDVLECNEKNIKQHYIVNCMGVIITTNHLTNGIYLPAEDRRHYVAWSECKPGDFAPGYWPEMWKWYDEGGDCHVAAYLATLDISDFDPKAPPPKTPAFWSIVNANRTTEEGELQDILDKLSIDGGGNPCPPDAVTIDQIADKAPFTGEKYSLKEWLMERKNRKAVNHRLENCGYRAVNNPVAKDGLWRIDDRRQMVYARISLPLGAQLEAAETLQREAAEHKAAEEEKKAKHKAAEEEKEAKCSTTEGLAQWTGDLAARHRARRQGKKGNKPEQ